MKKAGLKTFVYSFVFSLFTLFGVHGVYFRTSLSNNTEAKIPSKNITLFFKDASHLPSAQSVPAKKIVLSVLPEISSPQEIADKIPLNNDELDEAPTINQLAASDIPLQNAAKPQFPSQNAEKIVANFEQIIKLPPKINTPTAEKVLPLATELPEQPLAREPEPSHKKPIQLAHNNESTIQTHSAPSEVLALNISSEAAGTQQDETDSTKPASLPHKEKHELSIPLEKNSGRARLAKSEVKTADTIEENQVALNAHNVPIKSMVNTSASAKMPNQIDTAWQSMTEKQAAKQDPSPWVVAKGGKFPRNEMILQESAYKKDEDEIRHLLSTNTQSPANDSGTIKLASETVKNLLIPIPDEIMKEKNITPKLVSSGKNQSIEEELSVKENLSTSEDQTTEQGSTPLPPTEEKKGSILNSLSSIFSGKKSAPQIGNSVEDEQENKNSLLSAFTRKKARNTGRILPTEIRLSFQPNRAEISGQTLKWIRAFAQKTAEEETTGLEIRIDGTSSPLLQRRRLNLLHNILMNEGADGNKIRTVFTAREPNSFILRTVRINRDNMNMPQNRNINPRNNYMQW